MFQVSIKVMLIDNLGCLKIEKQLAKMELLSWVITVAFFLQISFVAVLIVRCVKVYKKENISWEYYRSYHNYNINNIRIAQIISHFCAR